MSHFITDMLTQPKRTLAIIGTAGRRDDADRLTPEHWEMMVASARLVASEQSVTHLVSGGAAWADHVAVALRGTYVVKLFLPESESDLDTARYYHRKFSRVLGHDTFAELDEVLDITHHGGFKDRNTLVADSADVFLAMTFGEGASVKDGGTADTVRKMRRRGVPGYHLDLNDFTLHKLK